ncbi:MAG: hypothetical protein HUJ96_02515 [Marinilabiliaceae bacterium]|nr:hypothetical protein [Marinilabiliaceae bacterium]
MSKSFLYIVLLFTLVGQIAEAQYNAYQGRRRVPKLMQGFHIYAKLGPTVYFGDLVDDGRARLGYSFGAEREMTNWMQVQAEIDGGFLHGVQQAPGSLEFKTTYFDIAAGGKVSVMDLIQGHLEGRKWTPYIGLGGGVMFFNAKKYDIASEKSPSDSDWKNVKTGMKATPLLYGLVGVTFRHPKIARWGFFAEMRPMLPFTDELDGHDGWRDITGRWHDGRLDFLYTMMAGVKFQVAKAVWYKNSKYNRRTFVRNKSFYKRSTPSRQRRR